MSASGPRLHLCADIGTSSLKAALIDGGGDLHGFAREGYGDVAEAYTAEGDDSRSDQPPKLPMDWENAFSRACLSLLADARKMGGEIASVCISGNGPTLVALDGGGTPLECLAWFDEKIVKPQGNAGQPRPSLFLSRVAWLLSQRPEVYEKTRRLISSQEYLSTLLGADPVTVLGDERYIPYYWDRDQLESWGISATLFPPFVGIGETIGSVSASGATRFGLRQGTPIVSGGADFLMALVGTGALELGTVCDRAGTSEGINVCTDRRSQAAELRVLPQLSAGRWNVAALLPTTGRLFEWFREITGQTDRDYGAMLREIACAASRSFAASAREKREHRRGGFFFSDLRAIGSLDGPSAFISTAGLTSRAELGRAVVESIGFMVRGAIETLERHGFRVEGMRLSGGQAKNEVWNRLKADITGRYLSVPAIVDGELAGDACAALLALGEADSLAEAASRLVRIERVYEPDWEAFALHSERYDAYLAMHTKMERFFG